MALEPGWVLLVAGACLKEGCLKEENVFLFEVRF
jgi:hypothetical protein|tara:strand:+ start:201 stop:302 length:102 start_codon:yes stop_codon:yes gene_type:complete